jgi:hypothetical protein
MGYKPYDQKLTLPFAGSDGGKQRLSNICPRCDTEIDAITTRGPADHRAAPCGHSLRPFTMGQITSDSDASGGIDT